MRSANGVRTEQWKQIQKIAEELKRIADAQVLAANASVRQAIAQEKISDTLVFINIALERLSDPTSFKVNERSLDGSPTTTSNLQGENNMSPVLKAGTDLQILDNGKGVLYTVQPEKAGSPIALPPNTPPAAISVTVGGSPSTALTVVPTPGDTTGLSFTGSIAQPPQDVDTVVAAFAYTFPDGVQLTATADPVDITPSETDPDSFVIQESAL